MRLIILGVKNKITGEYKALNVENNKNADTVLCTESPTELSTLSPFPFEYFSSITDDKDMKNWEEFCYLEVDGELTDDEFKSMKSSGIMYHRFKNRKVKLIGEFHEPFQYSLEMLNKFKEKLGTYDLTTWVIHNGTGTPGEHEAMLEIINASLKKETANGENYGTDISLENKMLEFLPYLLKRKLEGYLISFGRYGRNSLTQAPFDKLDLTNDELFAAYESITSPRIFSVLEHPKFNYQFYLESIKGTEREEQFLSSLDKDDLKILKDNGFPIEDLFRDYFVFAKANLIELFGYDENFVSIETYFADENYELREESNSPYDYYCCEDCDGYNIHEIYTDEELEPDVTYIDDRVEELLSKIHQWIPYLTIESNVLFDFIPENMYSQFEESGLTKSVLQ